MYVVNLCIIEFILSRPANYLHIKKIDNSNNELLQRSPNPHLNHKNHFWSPFKKEFGQRCVYNSALKHITWKVKKIRNFE